MNNKVFLKITRCISLLLFVYFASPFAGSVLATDITTNINEATTWTAAGNPYIITGEIAVGATLIIEPGVIIKFNSGASLYAPRYQGGPASIRAIGTADQPIVFTSNQPNPSAGDWAGISLSPMFGSPDTVFEYCIFEFGGSGRNSMIWMNGSSPILRNCQIRDSSAGGILLVDGATPTITSCRFSRNRLSGIIISDRHSTNAVIRGNVFEDNRSYPVVTHPGSLGALRSNIFIGNLPNAVQVLGDTTAGIFSPQTVANMGVPYVISGAIRLVRELTIDPGVTFKFDSGAGILIDGGSIRAIGEPSNPILFTSNQDVPSPGDWIGIVNNGSGPSVFQYCIAEYAGQDGNGIFRTYRGSTSIRNCTIRKSSNDGIRVSLANNTTIMQSNIYDNRRFNLNNETDTAVTARSNWWGSAQGPREINGEADTSNFLTTPVLLGTPRSPWTLFFPHFAAGAGWKTLLLLNNLETVATTVTAYFLNDSGNPQPVTIGSSTANTFDIGVPAGGTRVVEITSGDLSSGWIELLPRQKVSCSLVFQLLPQGQVISAAGVLPAEIAHAVSVSVINSQVLSSSVGLAIANPTSRAIDVKLELFSDSGSKAAETTLNIPAMGHSAKFVDELFPQARDWNGFIRASSELGLVLVPLKIDGSVISTIPAVRLR